MKNTTQEIDYSWAMTCEGIVLCNDVTLTSKK